MWPPFCALRITMCTGSAWSHRLRATRGFRSVPVAEVAKRLNILRWDRDFPERGPWWRKRLAWDSVYPVLSQRVVLISEEVCR